MFGGLDLNITWFILIAILLTGYAILDGFDLGIGTLHLFVKGDTERRIMLNSIGPVWDGNEVWLVTGGGALFAAFPHAYATVFSGFYQAFILLLAVIIFRAVSIEFRSKKESATWRSAWDRAFSISSFLIALLMGVAIGNVIIGLPIGADMELRTTVLDLLTPYPILVGVTTVALFTMHGTIFGIMKTEGDLQKKLRGWVNSTIIVFVICYILTTMITLVYVPHMIDHFREYPALFIIAFLNMLAIANIPREIHLGREFRAFVSSCASIAALFALFSLGIFPNVVPAEIAEHSLTIYNAASSQKTLEIMFIMALIGMPFVIGYTTMIYWIFKGKVKLDKMSY